MTIPAIVRSFVVVFFLLLSFPAHGMVFKIATLSPEGSFWMRKMREGAEEVAQKTNNRVRFKFYPGGVMGDDKAVLRKIRIGQLHGGAVVSGSLSGYFPDNIVYGLPLKFKSFDEVDYVRKRMDHLLTDGLEKSGFVTFGLAEGGFAYIMSNTPVRTLDDLRKLKVWAPDNDLTTLEAVKAFGITPIPLSIADVRASLQTGLIDTVTISPIGAVALQWHTQVNYLMDIPLLYIYGVLAVNQKAFSKISPDHQNVVREVMGRVFREIDRRNREDNVKALETLRKQSIQFVKPSTKALKEWSSMTSVVSKQLIDTGKLSEGILNTLDGILGEYRSQHADVNK